jgi:Protein of unknown function (DUF3099)
MKPQAITSLAPSPEADRRARMVKYSIAMGVRLLCIFACFFTPGWWLLVPAMGAIFLPYVAVVLANVSMRSKNDQVLRPGAILPVRPQDPKA